MHLNKTGSKTWTLLEPLLVLLTLGFRPLFQWKMTRLPFESFSYYKIPGSDGTVNIQQAIPAQSNLMLYLRNAIVDRLTLWCLWPSNILSLKSASKSDSQDHLCIEKNNVCFFFLSIYFVGKSFIWIKLVVYLNIRQLKVINFFFWVFSPDIVGIQLLFFLIWFVLVVIVDLQKLKNLKIQLIRYLLFSE